MNSHRPSCAIRAYTLVEVLIVVLLVVTLVALLLPVLSSSKDTAKIAVCTGGLKQIYNAVIAEGLNREAKISFPVISEWQSYAEAITEPDVLICPMDGGQHFKDPTNNIEFIPPPPSVEFNALQSDDTIFVFREQENFELHFDLEAITDTGTFGREIGPFDSTGIIPAGTKIDVFYFHFDPATSENEGSTIMHFGPNKNVMGFIGQNDPGDYELNESDSTVGLENDDVTYEKHHGRRLEGGSDPNADRITFPDSRHHISYDSSTANPNYSDTMRVITAPGAGSSYGMNIEVEGQFTSEHQIFLTDAIYPIIDFDDKKVAENSAWPTVLDARHFGKVNVLMVNGSVELMPLEALRPENKLWRR